MTLAVKGLMMMMMMMMMIMRGPSLRYSPGQYRQQQH